ncbi:uracil-DNA glycosylase [Rhodovulum sp. DZ06]|uniref:uracil-DNA glycosylase n=1 Tax=Rhodovulum sp. DZ06 TaxID=3425126 RepID=UPI003D34C800
MSDAELPPLDPFTRDALISALAWQVESGVDEAISDAPLDRFAESAAAEEAARARAETRAAARAPRGKRADPAKAPQVVRKPEELTPAPVVAADLAAAAQDLEALRAAVEGFDRCPLRLGAKSTVFAGGVPGARLMIVGEGPGRDEDREGLPFVGRSGQLLDRMMAAIGLSRTAEDPGQGVYITNLSPWRPLENRTPSADEAAMLVPFLRRHIELAAPDVLLLMGNAPWKALMETEQGITRARGKWVECMGIPAMPSFHPAFLLRQPARKRESWIDLQMVRARLQR